MFKQTFPFSLSETNNDTIYSIKITQQFINCTRRILTILYVHQVSNLHRY